MKLKNFASKKNLSEDDLVYAFIELGLFKSNGEPKNSYIKNGYFSDSGDVLDVKSVTELVDENINEIQRAKDMKQIEELQEQVGELTEQVNSFKEYFSTLQESVDGLYEVIENMQVQAPKKEHKHREMDMSNRARSLIGKKINGWTIVGDKLEVVATKGDDEIRMSGMCKKEDFLEQLEA